MARPQEFDRTEVVNAAIDVFHRQGYAATSVPDLVKATGLQPGSLYAAFGSKKGILIEALDVYQRETNNTISRCFNEANTPLEGIRNFFIQTGSRCSSKDGSYGCFMVNSLLEIDSNDEDLVTHLQKLLENFEAKFTGQLKKCLETGEIAQCHDPKALGKFLVCNIWGLQILAKTGPTASTVNMVVDQVMSHLNSCA